MSADDTPNLSEVPMADLIRQTLDVYEARKEWRAEFGVLVAELYRRTHSWRRVRDELGEEVSIRSLRRHAAPYLAEE